MENTTYDFVKKTKRDIYWRYRQEEIVFLQDKSTGRIKDEFAKPIHRCLICDSEERKKLFKKEGFSFWKCLSCGFIYSDPQIKEDVLMQYYSGSSSNDAWIDVLLSEANKSYDEQKYIRGLQKVESIQPPGELLDIGCSIGHFLKKANERNWNGIGLEINQRAVKYARETLDLTVLTILLHKADFEPESFRAVTLWGVVEHLQEPKKVMSEIHRILVPGGALLIFCPNVESLVCRILHQEASTFDGRNHCGYFSQETIKYLLNLIGFEVLEVEFYQPQLDTILNYLNYDHPYVKNSTGKTPIKALFSQAFKRELEAIILERGLGYKMMVLVRKVK